MGTLYDKIGECYSSHRRADPRIANALSDALGSSKSIVNVGAGTGSYEPKDRFVVSVEPSRKMLDQRPRESAIAIQASATALPFADKSFDAALAVLTVHHWEDKTLGLSELRRVASERAVIFTWNPSFDGFWLTDYFPEILDIDRAIFPTIEDFETALGDIRVRAVPIPRDCTDGFLSAYWSRPEAYLDRAVRSGMSTFSKIASADAGLEKLSADLASGVWQSKHRKLQGLDFLDTGYRLVIADF